MIPRILLVLGAALVLLAAPLNAHAITFGQPDGDDHPQVVSLLVFQDGLPEFCSGTLLRNDLVLTAGHCTESPSGRPNDLTLVSNDEAGLAGLDQASDPIAELLSRGWVFGNALAHPQYDFANFTDPADTYDIGVVQLAAPLDTGGVYGTLPDPGFLDTKDRGAIHNRQVRVVGYGLQDRKPPTWDMRRWNGTSSILLVGERKLGSDQLVRISNSPGQGMGPGGTCLGDSGGPAFWIDPETGTETDTVVALASFTRTGRCQGWTTSFRTDSTAALDFINQFL